MWMRRLLVGVFVLAACEAPPIVPPPTRPPPSITGADVPPPAIVGTTVRVTGNDLDRLGVDPILEVTAGSERTFLLRLVAMPEDLRALHFEMTREGIDTMGPGVVDVSLVLDGSGLRTAPFLFTLEVATSLPIRLDEGLSGDVHRNDQVVLDGSGFLTPSEGTLEARVVGTFTPDGRPPIAIDARVPVDLVDRTSRSRGLVLLTTDLGGNANGTLTGTMELESTLRIGGTTTMSASQPVSVRFLPPDLYAFDPDAASMGSIVSIRGAGFLGGSARPDETTLVRIDGTFTPAGGTATPWSMELVPTFASGSDVRLTIETSVVGGALVGRLFGAARGTLMGTATPITIAGTEELMGAAAPFRFTLSAPRQVVLLTFLPGYYESLARFGLAAAEEEIEARVLARIARIYAGYHLEVVTEPPSDVGERHYARVEIGGPDPNGRGLFGYDNSPGKDVGNLRLFDRLGGENAETQEDGFPGFGGVFVESLLWWSSHPDLPGRPPASSPPTDPLFDQMFDPVRRSPVTTAELAGSASTARLDEIDRAIRALSSIIGETTAHELGHSLGLAQPLGDLTAFHNDFDTEGCLMDRGGERPLGERAEEPGFTPTHLCYDEPAYLASILGD